MNKQIIIIAALSIVLFLAIQYIILEKYTESKQMELRNTYQQGYKDGATDAVKTLFDRTKNCQTTEIIFENLTKQFMDYTCLSKNSQKSKP